MSAGRHRRRQAERFGGGWRCHYCGKGFGNKRRKRVTLDHLIPVTLGGPNVPWNRVLACYACNHRKGDRTYEAFTGLEQLPAQCWPYAKTTAAFLVGALPGKAEQ